MKLFAERDKQIIKEYKKGKSMAQIGRDYGLCRQRVSQIIRFLYDGSNYRKNYRYPLPSTSELFIGGKLKSRGHEILYTKRNYLYDILVDGKIKVEVKHSLSPFTTGERRYSQYQFQGIRPLVFDYLIAIVGDLKDPLIYIIPSTECVGTITMRNSKNYAGKYAKFRDAWDLIK